MELFSFLYYPGQSIAINLRSISVIHKRIHPMRANLCYACWCNWVSQHAW